MSSTFSTICIFGASSVYGRGDNPLFGGFASRIKSYLTSQSERNKVYPLGISGETLTEMFNRTNEITVRKPDIIIFYSGYNDIVRKSSKQSDCFSSINEYEDNLRKLFQTFKTIATKVLIVLPLKFDSSKTTPYGKDNYYLIEDAEQYIAAQEALVLKEFPTFSVLNLFNLDLLEDSPDGLHPGAVGHGLIANRVMVFMQERWGL